MIWRMAMHHLETRLKGKASDKKLFLNTDTEQLQIPVIVNGLTTYSDTLEVPTMEEINIKENDSDSAN